MTREFAVATLCIFLFHMVLCSTAGAQENSYDERSEKSPWLAFGLSYVCPGLGQMYNGDYVKAIVYPTVVCLGVALAVYAAPGADFDQTHETNPLVYAGLGIAGVAYLWNMVDAPVSAHNINERIQRRRSGLKILSSQDGNYALTMRSNPFIHTTTIEVAINF